jgi:antitoxin MazE
MCILQCNITCCDGEKFMTKMHLGKWGRSLAVRIPRALVDELALREGDPIDIAVLGAALRSAHEDAVRDRRQAALAEIRKGRITLPPDWKFDREEANWRPAMDKW